MIFEIRRLTGDDAALWRTLRLEALKLHPENFLTTYAEEVERTDAERAAMLDGRMVFAIFGEGEPLGTAALDPEINPAEAHRASLNAVYIRKAARGQGAAQALMDHVIATARTLNIVQLELCVAQENAPAIAFYQRNYFVQWGCLPRAVKLPDRHQTDLFFYRPLDDAALP
ncbi:Histone acetyltransferase HPA2 and related acetyltransferase [Sulfitobacter noctilucicola]|uniref:Ribosomal protein S18 acetylase RimI-like enzyme n=1 Tax=Sulfitobacter noctilucicola TaxID=1342301 RepID=A0A7W6M9R9_9RHOB|nr:GNAT family N-acetyltransferase [Sulfitobacter noctilucicola]KIN63408.1 Histone acetyltransferase HPA2 and related acetyltransferase [Sulfitobacter noctilucicola]MBB4175076.1 ribosomal protein S18 acetylase RimI-like enzyme [Sulfitobacter noctilucicola]